MFTSHAAHRAVPNPDNPDPGRVTYWPLLPLTSFALAAGVLLAFIAGRA